MSENIVIALLLTDRLTSPHKRHHHINNYTFVLFTFLYFYLFITGLGLCGAFLIQAPANELLLYNALERAH